MDIVITYVNGLDPEWQANYARHAGGGLLNKRYRDWGTLPFLFRGIEKCMPFVNKVFLIVARESQVPEWIDRSSVNVVLHEDFIPSRFLPTFNSTAIEMFMHKIQGLGEEFIYFNDDFFPLLPCKPTDFFRQGRIAVSMARHLLTFKDMFRKQVKNSDRLARRAAGVGCGLLYVRPQHTCAPMLRSASQELYGKCESEILASVSSLRKRFNCNQYLYTDYMYFSGLSFPKRISNVHLSLSVATAGQLRKAIVSPRHKIACINDVEMSNEKFERLCKVIHDAFSVRFPEKSKYERC